MAQKIVNNGIKFAYASINPEAELKNELEKYFLYQTVLIVDACFEFGDITSKLMSLAKCNFQVVRNIDDCKDIESIGCIIIVNNHDTDKIKLISQKHNIPYVFALTDLCEASIFKAYAYKSDGETINCNFPLGIVLCLNYVFDSKKFISRAVLEISTISFEILQKKLGNLFFSESIEYGNFSVEKRILLEMQDLIENRCKTETETTNKLAKLYVSYALCNAQNQLSMIDNLLWLYKLKNRDKFLIEVKYAFVLMITSLEKNYFEYFSNTFLDTFNIERHQSFLTSFGLKSVFPNCKNIPNFQKIDFLLAEFREKLVDYVKTEQEAQKTTKNIVAEIDVDFLFDMFEKIRSKQLTNFLSLEPDIFAKQNFLSVLSSSGLLNYTI